MIQTKTIAMLMIAIATVGVTASTMSSANPVRADPGSCQGATTCSSGHQTSTTTVSQPGTCAGGKLPCTTTSVTDSGHVTNSAGSGGGQYAATTTTNPKLPPPQTTTTTVTKCVGSAVFEAAHGCTN